jgi:hypothetical protein
VADKKLSRQEIEKKAKDHVLKVFASFSNRSALEQKWQYDDALYNLQEDAIWPEAGRSYSGRSHLFPPAIRKALQSVQDFNLDVLFPPTSDWYKIKGVDGDADVKNATVYKKIADLQDEKIGLRVKVATAVNRMLKYGFVIVKFPYVYKDKYVIAEEKSKKAFKEKLKSFLGGIVKSWKEDDIPEKKSVAVYDSNDFRVISPWNYYWNYGVPWHEQTIGIEKIDNVTASHLKAQKKKGIYNDNVDAVIKWLKDKKDTGKPSDETDYDKKFPHFSQITGLSGNFDDGVARTYLLQADCYFDIDQDGYDELCIITLAMMGADENGKEQGEIIRMEVNPCDLQEFPVAFCPWDELEDMSLGMGIPQLAHRSQLMLNDLHNSSMDNMTEILDCTRIVDSELIDEGQNLEKRTRKVIKFKGNPSNAIFFDRPPNFVNEATTVMAIVEKDIQDVSRANIAIQGLNARYDTTGTEYTQMNQSGTRGLMGQIKNFEDRILKPYKRFQYAYNLQYLSRETLIEIIGKEAAEAALIDPTNPDNAKTVKDIIIGDYDFVPLGVTQTENRTIRSQQKINFLNIALKVPGVVNIPHLIKSIWQDIGDGDKETILIQPNEPSMNPNDENILLSQGAKLDVNPNDNDDEHTPVHMALQLIPDLMPNKIDHLKKHAMQKQKKMMAMAGNAPGMPGAPVRQQPNFQPKAPPMMVPGAVQAPAGVV